MDQTAVIRLRLAVKGFKLRLISKWPIFYKQNDQHYKTRSINIKCSEFISILASMNILLDKDKHKY